MCLGRSAKLCLAGRWNLASDDVLEVSIEALCRIQFGALAGQIEHFHPGGVLGQPRLDRPAVMDAPVVQNQKHLASGVGDEGLKNSISFS